MIILASESPRRREIFRYFSLPFEQVSHTFDESSFSKHLPPEEYAKGLSLEKAKNVSLRYPNSTIVAADTVVIIDNEILSKPTSRMDAAAMIHRLSGKWHTVVTGITVGSTSFESKSEKTLVLMNSLTEVEIEAYLDRGEWHDKVGGYAIQGVGSLLVNRIDGCYYNVMGLPVGLLSLMLKNAGINLWEFLV